MSMWSDVGLLVKGLVWCGFAGPGCGAVWGCWVRAWCSVGLLGEAVLC